MVMAMRFGRKIEREAIVPATRTPARSRRCMQKGRMRTPSRFVAFFLATSIAIGPSILQAETPASPKIATDPASLLARSQISYRAEGGFSGVESYGVIISCVNNQISVLESIHDPRVPSEPMRRLGHMTPDEYLALWDSLIRQAALKLPDGPTIKQDVLDEFTVTFTAGVMDQTHQFRAQALSLPECARYQAIRSVIDNAVDMASLWKKHDQMAGARVPDDQKITFQTLEANLELEP